MKRSLLIFVSLALSLGSAATAQPATSVSAPASSSPAPVERATTDAVARLYAQVTSERVEGTSIAEIIERVGGRQMLMEGLARAEQIGGPRPIADDVVQVNLEISGDRAADLVLLAVNANRDRSPLDLPRLERAVNEWSGRTFTSTGVSIDASLRTTSSSQSQPAPQTQTVRTKLPDVPPAWLRDAHTAEGSAPAAESPLRTARAAEKSARAELKKHLESLPLNDRASLGTAGRESAEAIDLAVAAARITSVDYRADGSVGVRVSIDGQQLWQTLLLTSRE